ncbi:MAG: metallophosphoesterase [Myxococcaceae bacterium]|jgi:predicted MPP superfamily phosphohydrolase|nr:metallophosphoesterase [Myxococcaceae bacterium]MCA3015341.1 metallophosphoesterase [Myxococcaceae bacterium]
MADAPETTAPAVHDTHPATLREVPVLLFVRGLSLVALVLALVVAAHWYLGARLVDGALLGAGARRALWAALWAGFGSIFVGFLGGRLLPRPLAKVAQWTGFVWLGTFGLLLTATAASDAVVAVLARTGPWDPAWLALRPRLVVGVVAPALVFAFVVARAPRVRRVTVGIPGLPERFEGFRIAQLTDVHIGETLTRTFAEQITRTVNALDPDAIAVTGDMVDGSVAKLKDEVAPLAALRSRHGVFYVTGNHEYYHGGSSWQAEARRLGMTVLHNQHVVLERDGQQLVIGGVPDLEGARFSAQHQPDAAKAFEGAPPKAPRVLLAHQPRFARHVGATRVELMLSGHTHGGQLFPFMFFVKLQQPVISGFAVLWGVPTYTSNGTGYWGPPFRLGPRGEITEVTLRRA